MRTIPGSETSLDLRGTIEFARAHAPAELMLKAVEGGGGRGIRKITVASGGAEDVPASVLLRADFASDLNSSLPPSLPPSLHACLLGPARPPLHAWSTRATATGGLAVLTTTRRLDAGDGDDGCRRQRQRRVACLALTPLALALAVDACTCMRLTLFWSRCSSSQGTHRGSEAASCAS